MKTIAVLILFILALMIAVGLLMGGSDGTPATGVVRGQLVTGLVIVLGLMYWVVS